MPSQKEVHWSELKIGIIVIVSIVLLVTLLFLMTSSMGLHPFTQKLMANAYFSNANNLKSGAQVTLEGVTVGEVTDVAVSTDPARRLAPVHVVMKIDPHFASGLHTDTVAALSTVGVLGDSVVDLNSEAAHGPSFQSGGEFTTQSGGGLNGVMQASQDTLATLNGTLKQLNTVVAGLQSGEGTMGQLLKNRALYDNANATLAELRTVATNINNGRGSVGKLLHDDTLYNHLNATTERLDALTAGLQSGKGTAGKLLTDDSLYNNLNSTLTHANSLLSEADAGRGGMGLLLKDPAFARRLNDTVTQLDMTLTNVNDGKGTLGRLATDDKAYGNLNQLLEHSTGLVDAIRQDPKKYLTIHMKIF